jgi:hypothetical protein
MSSAERNAVNPTKKVNAKQKQILTIKSQKPPEDYFDLI